MPGQLRGECGWDVFAQVHFDRGHHQVRRPDLVRGVCIAKEDQRMAARTVGITRAERQHATNCKLTSARVPLFLSDTLSATRKPVPDGQIKLYVCGVTPYDTTHLGHAFTFVQFDTLVRTLRWLGHEVIYVQNVTDIDDSILIRARKLGVDWQTLGDEQTEQYRADMRALNVADPTHLVRATSAIPTMLHIIETLIASEAAYVVDRGSVFFRVGSTPTYGELSKLSRAEMLSIASQQDDADVDDPRKEDPLDFALWKEWSGRSDEPCWDSPWGRGRPGWHVECSALCYLYLGSQLTIHGGGADLVFPHHESEIVQSEKATRAIGVAMSTSRPSCMMPRARSARASCTMPERLRSSEGSL